MTEECFWSCTPHRLQSYIEAYALKEEQKDNDYWRIGLYTHRACITALSNALEGRKSKIKYFEKPIHELEKDSKYEDGSDLPEEEKEKLRQALVNNLKSMEASHNAFVKQKQGISNGGQ